MAKHKVLSTKKLDGALIEYAQHHGVLIEEKEFISIDRIWTEEVGEEIKKHTGKVLVFTSANAVSVVSEYIWELDLIFDWPVFCLSGKTKKTVEEAIFLPSTIVGDAPDAASLAQTIIEYGAREVVFFCGDKRREELPRILGEAGITVHEIVVYRTRSTPVTVDEDYEAVLFFSPSAVNSFFSANNLPQTAACFAIGRTTAVHIQPFFAGLVINCFDPSPLEMIQQLIQYFEAPSRDRRATNIIL